MSQAQTADGGLSRRRYMQLVGAATATAAVGSSWSIDRAAAGIWDDVTDGAKLVGTGLYMTTPYGIADYYSGDWGVFQDDYQVAEAQMDAALRTAATMRDGDSRALDMAWNQLENARDVAWVEAQAAAIEPMRNGKSEEEVRQVASDAAAEYLSGTVESNVLNHWNAQVTKLEDIIARMKEHSDIDAMVGAQQFGEDVDLTSKAVSMLVDATNNQPYQRAIGAVEEEYTMLNGDTKTIKAIETINGTATELETDTPLSPVHDFALNGTAEFDEIRIITANHTTGASALWLKSKPQDPQTWSAQTAESNTTAWKDQSTLNKWMIVLDRLQTIYDDARANVREWASEAYGSLQAGDVDMTDVISPTAMASEMSTRYDETGHFAYAAAGLAALNLSVDYENIMTLQLSDGSTFQGTLFVDGAFEWSVGETINPSNVDGAIYCAVDASTYSRTFSAGDHYRAAIESGEVLIKIDPIDEATYHIETSAGETASVDGMSWEQTDPGADPELGDETDFTADLSSDLEQPSAEIETLQVTFGDDVQSETIEITSPFEIVEAHDVESGEAVDTVSGDGGRENYNTTDASQLEEILKQHRQYLDKHGAFESDDGPVGGGGIDVDLGGGGGIVDWLTDTTFGVPNWAIVATGGGALLVASR